MKSNKKKQGIELRVNILCLLFCFLLSVSMKSCDLLEFLSQVSKFLQMTSFDFVFFFGGVGGRRDIKKVQKHIFTFIFNRGGLWKTNGINLR